MAKPSTARSQAPGAPRNSAGTARNQSGSSSSGAVQHYAVANQGSLGSNPKPGSAVVRIRPAPSTRPPSGVAKPVEQGNRVRQPRPGLADVVRQGLVKLPKPTTTPWPKP